jgi:hypothetical protein
MSALLDAYGACSPWCLRRLLTPAPATPALLGRSVDLPRHVGNSSSARLKYFFGACSPRRTARSTISSSLRQAAVFFGVLARISSEPLSSASQQGFGACVPVLFGSNNLLVFGILIGEGGCRSGVLTVCTMTRFAIGTLRRRIYIVVDICRKCSALTSLALRKCSVDSG